MYKELRSRVAKVANAPKWKLEADSLGAIEGDGRRLRNSLETLLESTFQDGDGNETTGAMVIASALFERAANCDSKAFELVRDTVGEQPTARTAIEDNRISPETYAEVARLLELDDD